LDLLNIPIPNQAQGISLVGLMEDKNNALNNEFVYAQGLDGSLSIRSNQWKLIQRVDTEGSNLKSWNKHIQNIDKPEFDLKAELFNIQLDKKEKNNVIRDNFKEAQDLRRRLKSKLNSLVLYQKGDSEFMEGLSQDTKERITKTGYW
jgi:arylsulfatase A-like enzyme